MSEKVLLVDDDRDIQLLVSHVLSKDFHVEIADSLGAAREHMGKSEFDLILLDENLPDGQGTDFCHELRANVNSEKIPVITLTEKSELNTKLSAFDAGVDDYVCKPFEPLELVARIKSKLKRFASNEQDLVYKKGNLEFELSSHTLSIVDNGKPSPVMMTPIQFKVLYLLAKNEGKVYSREQILSDVWGQNNHVIDRTVDQHISKVRKKLKDTEFTIESVHGHGYTFTKCQLAIWNEMLDTASK